MIATLIGGKNDGAVIRIPFEDPDDVLPMEFLIQYKQGKLRYTLEYADFQNERAVYEYAGILEE